MPVVGTLDGCVEKNWNCVCRGSMAVGCVYACRYHIFVYIHILHESPNGTIEKGRGQGEQERIIGAYVQST